MDEIIALRVLASHAIDTLADLLEAVEAQWPVEQYTDLIGLDSYRVQLSVLREREKAI